MFDTDYNIIFSFISSFLVTYLAIPKLIFFADRYGLTDVAGKRASHEGSVPIFGGIAIFAGVMLAFLFWSQLVNVQFIMASLFIVFFVGLVDDLLGLNPYKKLIGQIIAVLVIIYLGDMQIDNMHGVLGVYEISDFTATLFTIFVVVVITNGFNLIDGVDGLASGLGLISSFCFGLLAVFMGQYNMAIIAFSLMGALLAFLKFNFPPARIFMGDTGSLLVGMILSVLAINLIDRGLVLNTINFPNKGPLLSIAILAIPLFDSLRVFIARVVKNRHPLYPARDHFHHALLRLGIGHQRTSLILYVLSIALILASCLLLKLNINIAIALLAVISFTTLLVPFFIRKKDIK